MPGRNDRAASGERRRLGLDPVDADPRTGRDVGRLRQRCGGEIGASHPGATTRQRHCVEANVTLHVQKAQPGEVVIAAESGLQPHPLSAAQTVGAGTRPAVS